MKHILKRAVGTLCASAMLLGIITAGGGYAENTKVTLVDNLARTATMTADSEYRTSVAATKANDGDFATYLQSNCQSGGDAWVCATWETPQTFDKIVFYCREGAKLVGKDYGVQVWDADLNDFKDLTVDKVDSKIGTAVDWESYNAAGTKTGSGTKTESRDMGMSTMTFDAQTTTAVRVIAKNFNNGGTTVTAFHILELEVYEAETPVPSGESVNIAPRGTAVVDCRPGSAGCLNDASANGSWMSYQNGKGGKTWSYYYGGITWDSKQKIISAVIYWRDMNASGFELQSMDSDGNWTKIDPSAYTVERPSPNPNINTSKFGDATESRNCPVDTVTFTKPVSLYGLRAYVSSETSINFQIYEFEVYSAPVLPDPTVTNSSEAITAPAGNIARDGTAFSNGRSNSNVNDGKANGSIWNTQKTVAAGTLTYVGIVWDSEKTVKEIDLFWRDGKNYAPAATAYTVKVSYDTTDGTDGEWVTAENAVTRKTSAASTLEQQFIEIVQSRFPSDVAETRSINPAMDSVVLNTAVVGVKGVRFEWTLASENLQQQLYELEVYSEDYKAPDSSFNDVKAFCRDTLEGDAGNKDMYIFTDLSQACVPDGNAVNAHVTVTRNGQTKSEDKLLWTAWSGVSLTADEESIDLTAKDMGNPENGFVVGILLVNLLPADAVDVTFTVVPANE